MDQPRTTGRRSTPPTRGGFTLLEVLIALAITSLTLIVALSAVSASQRNIAIAQLKSRATLLAREKFAGLDGANYPVLDPEKAINPGAEPDELIWIEEDEFLEDDGTRFYYAGYDADYDADPEKWRAQYYWQTIIESPPGMEGIHMLTVRVFTKRFRAREHEREWRDYIKEDYQLLVEIVTYRAAHYWAEADAR